MPEPVTAQECQYAATGSRRSTYLLRPFEGQGGLQVEVWSAMLQSVQNPLLTFRVDEYGIETIKNVPRDVILEGMASCDEAARFNVQTRFLTFTFTWHVQTYRSTVLASLLESS